MRWEKQGDQTQIVLEDGETERQAMRAIVKASFELARPAGLGHLHADPSRVMSDADADLYIILPDEIPAEPTSEQLGQNPEFGQRHRMKKAGITFIRSSNVAVSMDYVQGRQCKTVIWRTGDGQFELNDAHFTRDRGLPDDMLRRASEILSGKVTMNYTPSDGMFSGENLTLRVKDLGVMRQPGESDWDLRKGVFIELHPHDSIMATEFLFGSAMDDLPPGVRLAASLIATRTITRQDRLSIVRMFKEDTVITRQRLMAGQQN